MPLASGERLGPYEILALIGEGGMGEVYKARDTRLDRVVALKVSKADFTERFDREARAVAALNHPNICSLYDVGPNYLVMEFIEGEELKGPLSMSKAVEYSGQILDALDSAHRKGITHRDLKPANILVTKQGIKLLDFGLAKQQIAASLTDATVKAALTTKGEISGTLQYMAPEQLHGKEVDGRSDLFAFGCVLYEMLTGKRAFDGESAASVIASIVDREPASLDSSQPLDRIIKRCLAKDPDHRFQNALDLKTALTWALEQRPAAAAAAGSSRLPWWIAGVALIAGALIVAWALRRAGAPVAETRLLRVQIPASDGSDFLPSAGFALSPDGRMVAYVATHKGKSVLWLRSLEGLSARPLEGTEGARGPFWSPDSQSIAYTDTLRMYRIDLAGGSPRLVCSVVSSSGVWTPEGRLIFGRIGSSLLQVSADGGEPTPLTTLDRSRAESLHSNPQLLPGGRLLFQIRSEKAEFNGTYVTSLANPTERVRISSDVVQFTTARDGSHFLLSRRGSALVAQRYDLSASRTVGEVQTLTDQISGQRSATSNWAVSTESGLLLYTPSSPLVQLHFVDRTGRKLGDAGEAADYSTFRLSSDNRRIAHAQRSGTAGSMWMLDTDRVVSSRLTFGTANYSYPVWSPDGNTVVYRATAEKLYRKNANGSGAEERLIESQYPHFPSDWSRDSRYILYYENNAETQRDLWVLPVDSGGRPTGKPQPYLKTRFNEYFGAFSPEASPRWVVYQSDESGREEIYVQAFPQPNGKFQISTKGGRYARWGARGQEIVFVSPENKIMSATVKLNADSISASTPVELFALPPGRAPVGHPYDITSDGQRFLVPALVNGMAQSLLLIVNWESLLRRPTP